MRSVVISSGHGLKVRGASGYLDEVNEARRVTDTVGNLLWSASVPVQIFHDNTSNTKDQNLKTIVSYHNSQTRDLDVSVHFNAYKTTSGPMGTEVLYVTQQTLAREASAVIASVGHFINRGGKKRTDLYFLNNTDKPAILIEVCFCDSKSDCDLYNLNFAAICNAIAEVIGNVQIGKPEEIPSLPPDGTNTGEWQTDIETTVFGGSNDPNNSAYPPYEYIDDNVLGCSLPWRVPDPRPRVVVRNKANGKQAIVEIVDLGPWMVDDDYAGKNTRPVAETCFFDRTPLPGGPNAGQVPSNAAGLDVTPAVDRAIGLQGKGMCDWAFLEEGSV